MILTDKAIRECAVVTPCRERYEVRGLSGGLSSCGYDVAVDIKGALIAATGYYAHGLASKDGVKFTQGMILDPWEFVLVGVKEHFDVPAGVCGIMHGKSTWARRGLRVECTVLEPGWKGYLTIGLLNQSEEEIRLLDGDPIGQIVFHRLTGVPENTYSGKYQGQGRGPQGPKS